MSGLTDQELVALRVIADDWFPDTCTIQTRTESVDALGGSSLSWSDTYEDVDCRLAPLGMQRAEQVFNFALEGRSTWMLSVAYDQAITIEDRITFDSDTYEVLAVEDDHSYRTIRRALLARVN